MTNWPGAGMYSSTFTDMGVDDGQSGPGAGSSLELQALDITNVKARGNKYVVFIMDNVYISAKILRNCDINA